jgi:hypothetical protein
MRLELFIAELLLEHDCVIIPHFGGLVANYRSAKLHPVTHEITPPNKWVGFNRHLTQNDGLLQHHITQRTGLSSQEVWDTIQQWVTQAQTTLDRNEKVVLKNIGVWSMDRQLQLQFMPDENSNFLLESFGLHSLTLRPQSANAHPSAQPSSMGLQPSVGLRTWVAAASVIALAMLGFFAYSNHWMKTDMASWLPGNGAIKVSEYAPVNMDDFALAHQAIALPHYQDLKSWNWNAPAVTTSTKLQAKNKQVHHRKQNHALLVGGVFQFKENAQSLLESIQSNGFEQAQIIPMNGKFYVVFGKQENPNQWQHLVEQVRSVYPEVWVKH